MNAAPSDIAAFPDVRLELTFPVCFEIAVAGYRNNAIIEFQLASREVI
jgi:hypothetical protein